MSFTKLLISASALSLSAVVSQAEILMPAVFSDHMVLQRGQAVPVWGKADAGASVTVTFGGQKKAVKAGDDGKWKVELAEMKASKASRKLRITAGKDKVEYKDVLVGEVWLCSGQSNMEWRIKQTKDPKKSAEAADYPKIRFFQTPRNSQPAPVEKIGGKWQLCNPKDAPNFSAVAYYFGRKLHKDLNVPVGLLVSAWGGTRIEPWTPPCGFDSVPSLRKIYNEEDGVPSKEKLQKGNQQTPTKLYNGMIHPHIPFAIKGAIWYQGESNRADGLKYIDKTKAMVQGWRKLWGYDFPYYFVQIAPFQYGNTAPEELALLWEAQARAVTDIPKTGMAVISDYTTLNNIHPPNKEVPGERLALLALKNDYGKDVVAVGPTFKEMVKQDSWIVLKFDHAKGLKTRDGKAPDWFEVAGEDRVFHKATAKITGSTVAVSSDKVKKPLAVRFAWHKLATPNLCNGAGLPAPAFRAGKLPEPKTGVFNNVPEAKGYRVMYQIDVPKTANYSTTAPKYTIDNTAKDKAAFKKVAYYLELVKNDGTQEHVFSSMDAFTTDAKKLGIPTHASGASYGQEVKNLSVRSNKAGVKKVTDAKGGRLEFWASNYKANNKDKVNGADEKIYDFGDEATAPAMGYGCMQVHNVEAKQTVFALNHWGNGGALDAGIGNSTGKTRDWTFTASSNNYRVIRLTVLVK